MIRFAITQPELARRIESHKPGWLARAKQRTHDLQQGTRQNITNIWSEIKQVYMDLQGPKCGFCEKSLEESQAIEHDVEHFRPKNQVKRWTVPAALRDEGVQVRQPATGTEPGYRFLAYHPLNYVTACKTCNTTLKGCYFPIAGLRDTTSDDPTAMQGEAAYLLYPIGDVDDDPEELIEFHGLSPKAKKTGFGRQRALVTIALLQLDDVTSRVSLLKARARAIEHLYFALRERGRATTPQERANANAAIRRLTSPRAAHTNCLRSFERLWNRDPAEASSLYQSIAGWLDGVSL